MVNLHRRQPKLRMILWMVTPKNHHRTREERESPDTAAKPEGKSLKTSSAASSVQGIAKEGGTQTETESKESSGKDWQSAPGIEAHWRYVKNERSAREEAKKMHRSMPEWKLKDCKSQDVVVCATS